MKKVILSLALMLVVAPAFAQRYMTRTGRLTFFSATPLQNIEGINNETACAMDVKSGDLDFIVPVKSFKFESALMQEHFNENYLESDKFPKAEFKGKINDLGGLYLNKDGTYPVHASGKLTIHGVTRDVIIPGRITMKNGAPLAEAKFAVKCADYGVKIPSVVASKIAEEITVTVNAPMAASGR
jgi:polyisoprenoid-binding protein YceI